MSGILMPVPPTAREWRRYVRRVLWDHKITQSELARRLGVKPPQVSDWMTGKVEPGLDTARRVLLTLNRSVARAIRGAS